MTRNLPPAGTAGTTDATDPTNATNERGDDGAGDADDAGDDAPATARQRLQFRQSATPPAVEPTVYAETTTRLLGEAVRLRVIGSSHAVAAPGLDYYELSSCEAVAGAASVALEPDGRRRRFRFEGETVVAETVVEPRPLAAFPDDETFVLSHEFPLADGDDTEATGDLDGSDTDDSGHATPAGGCAGPGAVTTLDPFDGGFETYHTYPEFDLALYTRTTLERVASGRD
ncbi:DUF2617 family protein [Halobaculum sp. MBLA0143]|uniref:DUF2617 family protein n=1 Tax=Halobaculum sp. MBLA0143 TaxID=3079933 RepID=UPI003523CF87